MTAVPIVGEAYLAAAYLDGKILEIMTTNFVLSDTTFDEIKGYINARYALSL